MATLTHDEAVRRAALLDVHSYQIDLDLTRGSATFASRTVIRFGCAEPGAATYAEIKPLRLHHATLNGRALDPADLDGNRLPLTGLAADNELVVEADMAYSTTGEGLQRSTDPVDGEAYLYAQSALDDAQRMFACFDQPDLKAAVGLSATAPEGWTVIGNAAGGQVAPGRWEFAETAPISTYLVTLAAGPWHSAYAEHDGIPLGLHCRRSLADAMAPDLAELFAITRSCFDRYHELFEVRYPFGKYDQVFVPDFNLGAMENPGCVTFRDELFVFRSAVTEARREVRAIVIAHEMAHMWFGDLVTMRWWDDLWLNESFAEYMGHRVAAEVTGFPETWTSFSLKRKTWGYAADESPSTHPISSNVPDTARALLNFDGISYAKGASALRQLVTWLGEDAFFAGLNDYFSRHQYGNASLADLLESLSRHTERDLVTWSDRWLRTAQVNTVHSKVATTPEGRLASVELAQTAPAAYPTLRPHRLAVGLYDHDGSSVRRRAQVLVDLDPRADGGRTPVPELIGEPVATLLLPNDGDLTYAKIRLDDRSWDNACEVLYRVDDSLTRAMLWSVAWDMVRDAEFPAARYLGLVAVHLPYETSSGIFETVLGTARRQAIDWYTPLNGRTAALDALAAVCRKALAGADSGSSTQLVAAHGLSRCATSAGDLATVNGWLAGSDVPEGLDVGPDLRWSVLLRLVVAAVAGPAEIDAELARDPSDEGERGATRCRAALPDPDVKAAAWASMMDDDSLSPYLLQATAEGFWQPEQATVLAPYLPRYFAELPTVTARRGSPEMDRMLCTYGFPRYAVGTDVVAWVEKLLARDDLTPVAARFLTDELDRLRRVLAARVAG